MSLFFISQRRLVAPLAGAWIEISEEVDRKKYPYAVAPLAGAWIEICYVLHVFDTDKKSLPSRERGLKSCGGKYR